MKKCRLLLILLLFSAGLQAQISPVNSTGVEPMYSYKGGLNEAINLYNGNMNLTIPLITLRGRAGQDLNLFLSYDSLQMRFYSDELGSHAAWNQEGRNTGKWRINSYSQFYLYEWSETLDGGWSYRWRAEVILEDGGTRYFFDTGVYQPAYAGKGIGYSTNSTDIQYDFDAKLLSMKNGVRYDFSRVTSYSEIKKQDANGNYVVYSAIGGNERITDNMGRIVDLIWTVPSSWADAVLSELRVLNHAGQTLTYTFNYEGVFINVGHWGYVGDVPYAIYGFLTQINLPDGKSWTFGWHKKTDTDGRTIATCSLGRVDYPTGGYTRYNYGWGNTYLSKYIEQKLTNANNGQGELATNMGNGWGSEPFPSARVLEPDGSYYDVYFRTDAPGIESRREYFSSGGTLLKKVESTWTDSGGTNYRTITLRTYGEGGVFVGEQSFQYDGRGNVTQEQTLRPYEPSQSFRGRQINRTFVSLPNYIYRVQDEMVYDLNQSLQTTLVSQSRFSYDQFALTDRGSVTGHLDSYGVGFTSRGNLTTASRWLASASRWIDSRNYYDTLGNLVQTTDPRGYSTTLTYSSTFHYAYPTQVQNAKGHTANTNYNFNTGLVTSVTNENNFTTTTSYDSLNRISRIDYPDTSYKRFTYDLTANKLLHHRLPVGGGRPGSKHDSLFGWPGPGKAAKNLRSRGRR